MHRRRVLFFLLSLVLVGIIPFWIWLIAPWLTRLSEDFSYRADIISTDNFYDEAVQAFSGKKRTVTNFSYEVTGQQQGNLIVKNVFDVHAITGEPIFTVEHLYGIDPITGKHVAGFGDKDREGYLFAPRRTGFLRQTQDKAPFTYWHVNYDGPAHMTFAGEENLLGLPVYRYETHYAGVKIDQTKNLSNLPSVGITRGIELEPYLQLWIEPTSGHLIKYKDDTVAYYYDLTTGQRLNPWNHFSNTYTTDSVRQQVELAKAEKRTMNLVEVIIPTLLTLLAVLIMVFGYRKTIVHKLLVVVAIVTVTCIGAGLWLIPKFTTPTMYNGLVEKIRLGAESGLLASSVWIAEHNGYFKNQGLDVEITEFSSGRDAFASMLNNGNLDMATVAQTPFVRNSFIRDDYEVIAGMVTSPNDVKIIARKDSDIDAPADLKGKKVGITQSSTGHYFLSLFLSQHGLSLADVTILDTNADALPQTLSDGQVDAIATWEPHIYNAKRLLGTNFSLLESSGTFREDFYFTVLKEWAKNNPALLKRFIAAIDSAETFIALHPEESQRIVAERLNLDPLFVASVWSDYSFGLFLDQAMLLTFEQQARWAQDNNIVSESAAPNYLNFIYFDALEAMKPEAITIIH